MSEGGQGRSGWIVRKPDGTEIRFPSIDSLRGFIESGVVTPGDKVAPEGDAWANVEELAELAALLKANTMGGGAAVPDTAPAPQRPAAPPEARTVLEPRPSAPEPPPLGGAPLPPVAPPLGELPPIDIDDTVAQIDAVASPPLARGRSSRHSTVGVMLPSLDSIGPTTDAAPRTRQSGPPQVPLPPPLPAAATEPRAAPPIGLAVTEEDSPELDGLLAQLSPDTIADDPSALPPPPKKKGPDKVPTRRDMLSLPLPADPLVDTADELQSRQIVHATANEPGSYNSVLRDDAIGDVLREDRRNRAIIGATIIVLLLLGLAIWMYWSRTRGQETPTTAASDPPAAPADPATGEPPPTAAAVDSKTPSNAVPVAPADAGSTATTADAAAGASLTADAGPAPSTDVAAATDSASTATPAPTKDGPPVAEAKKPKDAKPKDAKPKEPKPAADPAGFDGLMRAAHRAAKRKPSEALRLYKKALKLKPSNADALGSVAKLHLKLGQTGQAIEVLKRCRRLAPRYSPCLYRLGRAYQAAGNSTEARKAYEKYLNTYPEGSYASDVRKRIGP